MLRKVLTTVGVLALAVAVVGATTAFAWGGPRNGGFRYYGDYGLIGVAAEELEMERADLLAELAEGKTLEEIALERGVAPEDIVDAFVAVRADRLERAVELGWLTEEEAAERLALVEERVTEHLTEAWPFNPAYRARDGFGMRGHGPGEMGRNGAMIHR